MRRRGDNQTDFAGIKELRQLVRALAGARHGLRADVIVVEHVRRACRGVDLKAERRKGFGQLKPFALVVIRDGEQHAALLRLRNRHLRGGKALEIGFLRRLRKAQRLAGGFHLRPKADLDLRQFFKAEYRHLDRDRRRGRIQSRAKAHLRHLFAQRRAHTQLNNRNARDLGDIRHGAG